MKCLGTQTEVVADECLKRVNGVCGIATRSMDNKFGAFGRGKR